MKNYYLLALVLVFTFYSCNDSSESIIDGPILESYIVVNSDSESLTSRVKLDNSGVIGLIDPDIPSGRLLEVASNIPLIMVSQVDAPEFEGKKLQATHVDIDGKYAYVSYNTAGDTYLGAVDIFDISNIYSPKITEQAIFKDADISAIEYKNGKLYLAAAVNIDKNTQVTSPANLITVSVTAGKFSSDFVYTSLPSYVATDVANTNSKTAVTSGNDGAIGLFDASKTPGASTKMEDLRAVAFGNNKLAVLSGTSGVHILDPNSLTEVINIPLKADVAGAKRTLDIDKDNLYVAEGANGAGIYKMTDGSLVQKLAIPINPADVAASEIVTNAVSVDKNLLFMANGGAGISITDVADLSAIKSLGVLDLDGSSNFVRNEEEFVFVATGSGGLQILKISKSEGAENCSGIPPYNGTAYLNINGNESVSYSGSSVLKAVNIGGTFLFCGSLAIEQNLNINSDAIMAVNGSFVFGQFKKNTSLNLGSLSTLKLQGNTVIYGDLKLNNGSTLEFIGEGNSITVYGSVTINSGAQIIGKFTDTEGKLK
ncbi:hypothetical protein LV84_02793 [Algoriphagus ratkowskyi]|uniref:LVIVD repeat-containing protein n=1 Tax=Algoriphagus ratkowskyi TaxID=57028 RepID=A0A2W7R8E0_9BACT|nr:hypothetical protein [Algoriphagus ratkowskyi]PZX54640.1 hypothetical protein LV84_02793 [Algoriphagus ratkowskyi]TXD76951.1 hypothetical protein ESW18_14180 [Algoriphagus ratkowskyi]